ncbi:hypothetical protein RJT34_12153 [Clitoria ternatea]|uniref:Uncharacterized protein n=1 Tax=Clitoria ternatea TaxID=43366 RepID=A0AAN9PL44_CLITE
MQNENTITKGVTIRVYVESSRTRSSKNPTHKTEPNPHFRMPKTTGTQGYDRKAQLLAYARELRKIARSENIQIQLPHNIQRKLKNVSKKLSYKDKV